MFADMELRWDRITLGRYHGFSADGRCLAQVAVLQGPDGRLTDWMVWLPLEQGELFASYPTAQEAMTAAQSALAP